MKSWKTPTPEQVQAAVVAIGRPAIRVQFFTKLENPYWVEPLRQHGVFKKPAQIQREGNSFSFPHWAEGRYLVRMASCGDPGVAKSVVDAVVETEPTDNQVVHLNYVEIALAVGTALSRPIVKSELKWLNRQPWLFPLLPEKYSELVERDAASDAIDDAFALARALLAISPDKRPSDRSEPGSKFEHYFYRDTLLRSIGALKRVQPLETIRFLCDLVDAAIRIKAGPEPRSYDLSIGWRSGIESNDQNFDHGSILDALLDATRDTLEEIVRKGSVLVGDVLKMLRERHQPIFDRMAIHLARVLKDQAPDVAHALVADITALHSLDLRPEYMLLLRDVFPTLEAVEQDHVLRAITAGPAVGNHDLSTADGRADFESYSRSWKLDRLAMIQKDLPEGWRHVYDALVEEFGQPRHPEHIGNRSQVGVGPVSPKRSDELLSMSLDVLVEFLVVWRPKQSFMAPSPNLLSEFSVNFRIGPDSTRSNLWSRAAKKRTRPSRFRFRPRTVVFPSAASRLATALSSERRT